MKYLKSLFMKDYIIREALLKQEASKKMLPSKIDINSKVDIAKAIQRLDGKEARNRSAI